MHTELALVAAFHKKYAIPINTSPACIAVERTKLRTQLMQEEVDEYQIGTEMSDIANIAKELADILYTVYGTIIEHGLQNYMPDIFAEVHRANMTKESSGGKPKKGIDYVPADIQKILPENECQHSEK